MSIDLDIIPGIPQLPQWRLLKLLIKEVLNRDNNTNINSIVQLSELSSKRQISEDECLRCPGYYYFTFAHSSTLSLSLEPIVGGHDEADYIEDFARGKTTEFKELIRRIWNSSGFLITLSSGGGRAKNELSQMVKIAGCIATLTEGYVVISDNNIFLQCVGIYTPNELV